MGPRAEPSKTGDMLRRQAPLAITLLLLILSMVPSHLPGMARISPMPAVIAVFYWVIYRPDCLGLGAAFCVGLTEDILLGLPLGTGALTLLLLHAIVGSQRRFFHGKPFHVTWWAFVIVCCVVAVLRYLLVCALHGAILPVASVAFSAAMTIALYPLIGWMLVRTQLSILKDA